MSNDPLTPARAPVGAVALAKVTLDDTVRVVTLTITAA